MCQCKKWTRYAVQLVDLLGNSTTGHVTSLAACMKDILYGWGSARGGGGCFLGIPFPYSIGSQSGLPVTMPLRWHFIKGSGHSSGVSPGGSSHLPSSAGCRLTQSFLMAQQGCKAILTIFATFFCRPNWPYIFFQSVKFLLKPCCMCGR